MKPNKFKVLILLSSFLVAFNQNSVASEEIYFEDDMFAEGVTSRSISDCRFYGRPEANKAIFDSAVAILMNPNTWAETIGMLGQDFQLTDAEGKSLHRLARGGDLIKITPPFDPLFRTYWVRIENTKHTPKAVSITVRPTANPLLEKRAGITDHFFASAATNEFIITYSNYSLTVAVIGKNEFVNDYEVRSKIAGIANFQIAHMLWGIRSEGEAKLGLQSLLWDRFTRKMAVCD
jgi:hypothetical protein